VYIFDHILFYWQFSDAYAQTKAEAEKLVIKANCTNGLLTCCLRPGAIFGLGDIVIPNLDRYAWMRRVRDSMLWLILFIELSRKKNYITIFNYKQIIAIFIIDTTK